MISINITDNKSYVAKARTENESKDEKKLSFVNLCKSL